LQWQAQKLQKSRILLIFNCNSLHTKRYQQRLEDRKRKEKQLKGEEKIRRHGHLLSLIMLLIARQLVSPSVCQSVRPSVLNSRSGAHSILFWVEKSAGNTLRQMLSSCWFRTLGDVVVPSVCRALINALNHINVAKCFKVSLSRSAFVCLLGFLRRTFGPVNKPA